MKTISLVLLVLLALLILLGGVLVAVRRNPSRGAKTTPPDNEWTSSLRKALDGTTRLRVRSGGTCHHDPAEEKTLLDLRDPKLVAEVTQHLAINPDESGFHCMCCGNPTLEFYRDAELVASLGYHHGQSLRWLDGRWNGDGLLTEESRDYLNAWLYERGVRWPKEERERNLSAAEQAERYRERWRAAMPVALRPFGDQMEDPIEPIDTLAAGKALAKQLPDQSERILALLGWYGSGQGPWSGYPSYESAAEEILLLYRTEDVLSAIRGVELTTEQTEGAARFFGGWSFAQQRPDDLALLPDELKQKLLNHSLKADDEDKKGRAMRAFAPQPEKPER